MSKTFRMTQLARKVLEARHIRGRPVGSESRDFRIWPANPAVQGLCVDGDAPVPLTMLVLTESRAGAGQRLDERPVPAFSAAHGIMIITPVYWYQSPSVLKLLMDRMVCADGGNPDPTSTQGKNAARALATKIGMLRRGIKEPDADLNEPRPK
jgi:hypothetical protein